MFLKCSVVILFFCFFATSRGDVQGEIDQKLSALDQNLKILNKVVKKISRDVQKLLNDKNDAEKSLDKTTTLTMAEMVFYQRSDPGLQGLGYYVELEAIRDGKMKKNIIPMLVKINKEQKDVPTSVVPLFETLNHLALAILRNREEAEIEDYYLETKDNIRQFITTMESLKSAELKKLGKKVLLKVMKDFDDIRDVQSVIIQYEDDTEFVDELFEKIWLEVLVKYPISDAIEGAGLWKPKNYKVKAFEKLLTVAKGDDMLKVIDAIFSIDDPKESDLAMELRNKVPYNDEALKIMTENSTEPFRSKKLNAIMLNFIRENNPNDPKIINLALELLNRYNDKHMDIGIIEEAVKNLPKPIVSLAKEEKFCISSEERYLFVNDNTKNVLVTQQNEARPQGSRWSIRKQYNNFIIMSENRYPEIITSGSSENRLRIEYNFDFTTWIFNFTDIFPRAKIGNGKQYFKIEGDHVILDDIPTIWDLFTC